MTVRWVPSAGRCHAYSMLCNETMASQITAVMPTA